jgi:hypothetical protein
MRKAIAAFEQEFAQWGLSLPAQDIVDRQAGHMERHGWRVDYSFGTDAFGEYLEYHARRAVANEPVIERHARVYHNGERNFVPAPPGAEAAADPVFVQPDTNGQSSPAGSTRRPTLPPWKAMVEEATGDHRHSAATATRDPSRPARRPPARTPFHAEPSTRSRASVRTRPTATAFAIGVGAAVLVALAGSLTVRAVKGHRAVAATGALPDSLVLEPVVVYAPTVLGFPVDSAASRFTQPLVGTRSSDPNRAEIVRPEHGMTPIIPSDPAVKRHPAPAATSRGGKFHVP